MGFASGLKTIVVATDLHGRSEAALEYARKLAAHYEARIVLAHGTDPVEYASVDAVPGPVLEALPDEARQALEKLSGELLREGIPSHSELRQGAVAGMLVDVARQYEADLIVVGTRGMEGAGPVVVGAVAEQLVRRAPCAVLAVAADWNAGPFRPTPGGPVMLAMEQNEAADEAVAAAQSLARTFRRPLIVVHAKEAGTGGDSGVAGSLMADPCAATHSIFAAAHAAGLTVHCLVKEGSPAEALAEAIAEYHPCILVAGVKRESETPGPHGTVFALLASSRVPVLCVPPGLVAGRLEPDGSATKAA
jgi:nucleotide-binding universal stress UspA family protein